MSKEQTATTGLLFRMTRSALGRLVIASVVTAAVAFALFLAGHSPSLSWLTRSTAFLGLAVLAGLAFTVHFLEASRLHRDGLFPVTSPGLRLGQFAGGLLLGAGLNAATVLIIVALGAGTLGVGRAPSPSETASVLGLVFLGAFWEETFFRGLLLRLLSEAWGPVAAVIVSSAIFGFAHSGNPGATAISTLAISLEAGTLLAAAWYFSRSLWLPMGLHLGWNFTQSTVLGAATSGHDATASYLQFRPSGPGLITGGEFGPEASMPAILLCALAALAMFASAWVGQKKRGPPEERAAPTAAKTDGASQR